MSVQAEGPDNAAPVHYYFTICGCSIDHNVREQALRPGQYIENCRPSRITSAERGVFPVMTTRRDFLSAAGAATAAFALSGCATTPAETHAAGPDPSYRRA